MGKPVPEEQRSDQIGGSGSLWQYGVVAAVFCFLLFYTRSSFLNDTIYYSNSIDSARSCTSLHHCPELWEAGHLLWRPFGLLLSGPLLPLLSPLAGNSDPKLAITLLLIVVSGIGSFVAALFLYAILIRMTGKTWICLFLTIGYMCARASLYELHSGTSYQFGQALLVVAIWLAGGASGKTAVRSAICAAVVAGVAVGFWLTYLFSLPAVVVCALMNRDINRVKIAAIMTATLALTGLLIFGCGAWFHGVGSVADLKGWVTASGHGTVQTNSFFRTAFGLPRSFVDLGQFGLRLKQFLLKDPFARVTVADLLGETLWKIALFYLALLGIFALLRKPDGRRDLLPFLVAFAGNMVLALLVYEGGSPERYLPCFPFFFMAAALCLSRPEASRLARIPVYLLFVLVIVGNISASSAAVVHEPADRAAARVSAILPLPPESMIFTVADDSVSNLYSNAPFHEIFRRAGFVSGGVYLPMLNSATWKRDFSKTVLSVWDKGGDVWITTRVWSPQPRRDWNWSEGDDPIIRWKTIVDFFSPFEHTPPGTMDDGFVKLIRSAGNQALLRTFAGGNE